MGKDEPSEPPINHILFSSTYYFLIYRLDTSTLSTLSRLRPDAVNPLYNTVTYIRPTIHLEPISFLQTYMQPP